MGKLVTVVIPCRNEEQYIANCVESILNQGYQNLELLVVDGMSDDKTLDVLKRYSGDQRLQILKNTEKVTPIALNLGIEHANGDIVIIFGAHAEMLPDYIEKCMRTFQIDEQIGCVGGVLYQLHENLKAKWISNAMSSPFGVGNAHFRTGLKSGYVDTVAFGAYKKEVFYKIGLFDASLVRNQDDEFNYRLIQSGYKIYLNHEIKSNYYVRSSFMKLYKQYFQYGYWKVFVNKKHKTVTTYRQLVPAVFVASLVVGVVLALISATLCWVYFSGILLYFGMSVFFAIKKTSSIQDVFGVIWSFLLLHIGYGLGYWKGFFEFIVLNKTVVNKAQRKLTR